MDPIERAQEALDAYEGRPGMDYPEALMVDLLYVLVHNGWDVDDIVEQSVNTYLEERDA